MEGNDRIKSHSDEHDSGVLPITGGGECEAKRGETMRNEPSDDPRGAGITQKCDLGDAKLMYSAGEALSIYKTRTMHYLGC